MVHSPRPQTTASCTPSASHCHRKPWSPPEIAPLPRLSDLTLQSGGIPGGGDTGGGGSTVVP
jgi:hypothetical protein